VPLSDLRCPRCRFPTPGCLCAAVPSLRTGVEFVFVRHASERTRLTNTGHWAALALEGSRVVEQGVPGAPLALAPLAVEGAVALFPGPPGPAPRARPRRIVVPDGTWAQARRIMQRVPALRTLPRLALAPSPAATRLRRPTVAGGMSTLEAVAAALRALGEAEAAERLDRLHEDGIALVARLGRRPSATEGCVPRSLGGLPRPR
jgi:DTW domain-containing protein YfiP